MSVEAQNHYYGHTAALAAYAGLPRPMHIPGLLQHGWTAVSPLSTHFRDFPEVGTAASGRRLLVWSHGSRAWRPGGPRSTTAIGSPWLYLARLEGAQGIGEDTVVFPVHGIETQPVQGDHEAQARSWAEAEGPSTVCLYVADAQDPEIVSAYRRAGHRVVTLGRRHDPRFLWRLHALVGYARRVVSNRVSTPVFYAAAAGREIGVYGDPMRLAGESAVDYRWVRDTWPELHHRQVDGDTAHLLAAAELGAEHLLAPPDLVEALGWSGGIAAGRAWLEYWVGSPMHRARVQVRRRRDAPGPGGAPHAALSATAWLRGAATYLPRPLPRASIPGGDRRPLVVART